MNVSVNGHERELEAPCSIEHLLALHDLATAACAVEVNAELVPKASHARRLLEDGDVVEIVTLVGGG